MTTAPSDRRAIITEALHKIDDLTARLEIAEKGDTEPIAVVGMGCRLPGGVNNPAEYWQFLQDGANGVVRVPADRWDADDYYSDDYSVPGTICNREGGFLTSWQPDEFDAAFFGIPPREAAAIDPQQRLLLEVAWEALENAGITPQQIRRTQTAVFVGLTANDYGSGLAATLRREDIDQYIPFGNASNFAAGRLSYFLGLQGPAVVIDTACSSSLVAIHLACQSLRRRESDNALAAGVNLLLRPENNIACSRAGMLAPDGLCKTFDAAADGYVRSEGCGVVVLKRLSDAQRDGDRIWALVRGTAVNQDGASSGQTVPNGPAQQALLRQALAASRLQPSDIDYIEAHGTGTALGDPIELDALSGVFSDRDGSAPLVLGSVKTNVGHMESAAGVGGFIKTALSLYHGYIPKHLNFERLTPHAGVGAASFTIASEALEWPSVDRARRAGVSSFGVSGTNAHVVVEQAPVPVSVAPQVDSPKVTTLVISGKTPARIASMAAMLAEWMTAAGSEVTLPDVAHTVNHHRARHQKFASVTALDRKQAIAGLRALAEGYPAPGVAAPHAGPCGPGTVFVYPGQGSQWAGMGRQLLADEPAFAAAVAELEPTFIEQVGFSLLQVLANGEPVSGDARAQPVIMGLQLALTELWRSYGVSPDAVIGHSMGEVTASVVAGALSPAEGLRVIAVRSQLMSRLAGQGASALLKLDADAATALVADYPAVSLAGYASPRETVIAGPPDQVEAVVAAASARSHFARRVNMDVASHTAFMDPILPELRSALADLTPKTPTVPFISTVVDPGGAAPVLDADYWVANVRQPVQFSQAIAVAGKNHATFIEISPNTMLTKAISDTLRSAHHHSIGTLQRDTHDGLTFHTNLNATHTIRPPKLPHPPEPHPLIPVTPWHHTQHWISAPEVSDLKRGNGVAQHTGPKFQGSDAVLNDWFYELTWPQSDTVASESSRKPSGDGSWLVLGDTDLGTELGNVVGSAAAVLSPTVLQEDGDHAALAEALNGVQHVLFAPPVPPTQFDVAAGYRLFNGVRRLVATLGRRASPPKLFFLTRNAQPLAEGDRANPTHAVLWGLGRTLALEHPELWGGVVDLDDSLPPELAAQHVVAEMRAADGEDQVVYKAGHRRVPRLQRRAPGPVEAAPLRGDASHLVIGATGRIGPHLVRELAELGATTIVAVSRNAGSQLDELAASLASTGTRLIEVAADAADESSMTALFARFGNDLPPLDGIYLAAMSGRLVLLSDMTDDDVNTMFRPKLDAVAVLHNLSLKSRVRRFVIFSSISGVIGSRWFAHYSAAGAYLDTVAYARRSLGLPATVIDWGMWRHGDEAQPATTDAGLQPMAPKVAIRALAALLDPDGAVQTAVAPADWNRLAAAYRTRGSLRVVDALLTDGDVDTGGPEHARQWIALEDPAHAAGSEPQFGTVLGEQVPVDAIHVWQARLLPEAKPYPGFHRIQGVEVVPVAVFLHTLLVAAAQCGAATLSDVRFEYPIVVDQPRVIQVVADAGSITVSSSPATDTPAVHGTRHAGARISEALPREVHGLNRAPSATDHEISSYDASSVAELQQAWGIEGQPFPWSIDSWRSAPDGLRAEVDLPGASGASMVALLDAAVHVARLVDSANPTLLLPAGAESVWFGGELADARGSVEVYRRGGSDHELIVDIVGKASDGSTCVDIRGFRYADLESGAAQAGVGDDEQTAAWDWSQIPAGDLPGEVQARLREMLARELGMPASAVDPDLPFPELGLDSMMVMTIMREAKQMVGIELSLTAFWNHPTVSSLAAHLAELLVPHVPSEEGSDDEDVTYESGGGLLDELFDSVESATAGSESGLR
jgi:phthiocerol/phenolphthiocerol synthesis type-I polyketide synthase B